MTKFAVFVATTGGPVQIERLTPERAPQSMICISRSSTILPISREYDDFVRRGSGVIEREFGPFGYESFRADVSGAVGTGQSWQLAFFLAHAIDAADDVELVENMEKADCVVWATGRVDYDLKILEVDHVAEKLQASRSLFEQVEASSLKGMVITPAFQSQDMVDMAGLSSKFSIIAVEDVINVCQVLDLNLKSRSAGVSTEGRPSKNTARVAAGFIAGAVIIGSLVFSSSVGIDAIASWRDAILSAIGIKMDKIETTGGKGETPVVAGPKNGSIQGTDLNVTVTALKPPPGRTCLDVIFGDLPPVEQPLEQNKPGQISASALEEVCRLSFSVDVGETGKYVAVWLDVKSGRYIEPAPRSKTLSGSTSTSGRQSWSIELPRRMDKPFVYRLVAISGDQPLMNEMTRLENQSNWNGTTAKLAKKGIRFTKLDHRVNP